jgi:hypothetical protein
MEVSSMTDTLRGEPESSGPTGDDTDGMQARIQAMLGEIDALQAEIRSGNEEISRLQSENRTRIDRLLAFLEVG